MIGGNLNAKQRKNLPLLNEVKVGEVQGLRIIMCNSKLYDNYEIHEKEKLFDDSMEIYANVIFNNILENKDYICCQ